VAVMVMFLSWAMRWCALHYADLLVMPMPGFPALVAGVAVLSGAA
jgi:hypothetical protein